MLVHLIAIFITCFFSESFGLYGFPNADTIISYLLGGRITRVGEQTFGRMSAAAASYSARRGFTAQAPRERFRVAVGIVSYPESQRHIIILIFLATSPQGDFPEQRL